MALYEYHCQHCKHTFEELTASMAQEPNPELAKELGKCPRCESNTHTQKLISRFAVGGRGDLRESTFHGCHDGHTGVEDHDHSHEHSHDD